MDKAKVLISSKHKIEKVVKMGDKNKKNVNTKRGGFVPEPEEGQSSGSQDHNTTTDTINTINTNNNTNNDTNNETAPNANNNGNEEETNRLYGDGTARDHRLLDQPSGELEGFRLSVDPGGQGPGRPSTSTMLGGTNMRDGELSYQRCDKERLTFKAALALIPSFDGRSRGDLQDFMNTCKVAFKQVDVRSKGDLLEAVLLVKLKGKASQSVRYKDINSYSELEAELKQLYGEKKSLFSLQNEFSALKQRVGETVQSFGNRVENTLVDLVEATLREEKEEIGKRVLQQFLRKQALEIFKEGLNDDVRMIVKARNPSQLEEAISQALEEERLKETSRQRQSINKPRYYSDERNKRKICRYCKKSNHEERNCRYRPSTSSARENRYNADTQHRTYDKPKCYICNLTGHYARDCRKRYREPDRDSHKADKREETGRNVRMVNNDLNEQAPEDSPTTVRDM